MRSRPDEGHLQNAGPSCEAPERAAFDNLMIASCALRSRPPPHAMHIHQSAPVTSSSARNARSQARRSHQPAPARVGMSVRARGRVPTTVPASKATRWKPHDSSATDGCWFTWPTGLPPHQYVIARRVERPKHLLQGGAGVFLAEVSAAHAGFCDQSQFSHHFKRLLGATPGQFRTRIRNAQDSVSPAKKTERRASWDSVRSRLRKDEE